MYSLLIVQYMRIQNFKVMTCHSQWSNILAWELTIVNSEAKTSLEKELWRNSISFWFIMSGHWSHEMSKREFFYLARCETLPLNWCKKWIKLPCFFTVVWTFPASISHYRLCLCSVAWQRLFMCKYCIATATHLKSKMQIIFGQLQK